MTRLNRVRSLLLTASLLCVIQSETQAQRTGTGTGTLSPITLPRISTLTLNPTSVTGGAQVTGTVILDKPALSGGTPVTVRTDNAALAAVPASIVVQPGATSGAFIVQTVPVAATPNVVTEPPSVAISAQIGSATAVVATLTVRPPTLNNISVEPATLAGGVNAAGTITLTGPAAAGGVTVPLSVQTNTTATERTLTTTPDLRTTTPVVVPREVSIPAGSATASFPITTRAVASSESVQIVATWGPFVTRNATLTVTPPGVADVALDPLNIVGGKKATGTVRLNVPAPPAGLTVNLSAYRAGGGPTPGTSFGQCGEIPSVPAGVIVAGGALTANFAVSTQPGYGLYVVRGSTSGGGETVGFSVNHPAFALVFPSSVSGGALIEGTLQLTGPAMPSWCGNRYTLTSSNTTYAQVPSYVDVTPGTASITFAITTTALPSNISPQTVTIAVRGTEYWSGVVVQHTREFPLTITP